MSNPGPASTVTTANLGGGSPEVVGNSASSYVGFWGATPVVQPASASQSVVPTTAITTLATTPTATDIAVAVNSLIARVAACVTLTNQIRSDLVTVGIEKGSA